MDSKESIKKPEELLGPLNEVERKFAPEKLFLKGNLQLFEEGPRVAIVGSRNPSEQGRKDTIELVKNLVHHKVIIVSGLAKGIDTVAHKTAISEKGNTIAVLGTPLNNYYPAENKELQQMISKDNLVISQFPKECPIQKMNFPLRNRTMALLSHATVIVEAGETSGTIHQGWEALRLGRPLFIMNKLIEDTKLSWPKKMVNYGAIHISTADIARMLEALPANGSSLIDVALRA